MTTDIPLQALSLREAATQLSLSIWTLRRAIHDGRLPAFRMGARKHWRILRSDLERICVTKRAA